ncbi:MAG: extracellular solute-binding protein, partial [Chloroflexi bacterium]
MTLHVALIDGPMYSHLYHHLEDFIRSTGIEVEIAFQGDHPALNAHLESYIERPGDLPYDLVSTHSKYFPSQLPLLAPLDDLLPADAFADFAPLLLDMVRLAGRTYCLPRNIDVRLLHYRTDLIETIPPTWGELLDVIRAVNDPPRRYGFVFPGMESGLFGTFYELAEMGGARLFPPDLVPRIQNEGGRWALNFLRTCYMEGLVPPEIPGWHYDKVHDCFRDDHAVIVGDWPGYYNEYCDPDISSRIYNKFSVTRYPAGPLGRSFVYGGAHTFALTLKGALSPDAAKLLHAALSQPGYTVAPIALGTNTDPYQPIE